MRGGTSLLNPPPETPVAPDDLLVVITRDDDTAWLDDCAELVEREAVASRPSTPAQAERILSLGWNRRAPLVVDQLHRRARPGSAVDVVAERGEATIRQVSEADADDGSGLSLALHHGDVTRPETLRRLDVPSCDSVIVLGRDPVPGQPPDDPDSRTLVTLLLLRRLEEATGRELPVVTELIDDRNRAPADVGPRADVIISGRLIGPLMSRISRNRHLAAVFEELFSAEGAGVRLRPATDYVLPGNETFFAAVVAAARRRGACAIGYRCHDDSSTSPHHGVRINPLKRERCRWTTEDEVVVIVIGKD